MKEKIKKFFASIAAIILAIGMMGANAIPAMASTVHNDTDHTYNVYQIFTGTQSSTAGDTKLGDIAWGSSVSTSGEQNAFLNKVKGDSRFEVSGTNVFSSATTASDVANTLSNNTSMAEAFANVAADYVNENSITAVATVTEQATSPDLAAGYYLFVDTHTAGDGEALNSALLQVTNSSEGLKIQKKYDVPTPSKTIEKVKPQSDNDDSTTAGIVLTEKDTASEKDSAVAEIGDIVTFHLSAKLPSNLDDYSTYKFEFVDTLSAGLEYVSGQTPTVKIGDDSADNRQYTITTPTSNDNKLKISWTNIKDDTQAARDKVVSVEYTAKVTSAAVTGTKGNTNTIVLNYSNNPNGTGEGKSTPEEVKVYTFKLNVKKTDNNNQGLAGAGFVLKNSSGKFYSYDSTNNIVKWVDGENAATELYSHADGKLYASTDASDTIEKEFTGLAEGEYTLHEKTVPSGYNQANDVTFTINAIAQSGTNEINLESPSTPVSLDKNGDYNVTVVNNAGSTLPSTGGIGTTIFYVIGGAVVAGAIVLLIARRRKNA